MRQLPRPGSSPAAVGPAAAAGGDPTHAVGLGRPASSAQGRERRSRWVLTAVAMAALACLLIGLGAVLNAGPGGERRTVAPPVRGGATAQLSLTGSSASSIDALTSRLQSHLRAQPKDARSWAVLGAAYVEQARVSGDASFYPKAEGALDRSLGISPTNNDSALAGLGALAAGRHDFSRARQYAEQAIAVNPESAAAYGVLSDALTELSRYDEGRAAAGRMDDLQPSLASAARLAYHVELRADTAAATRLLSAARAQSESAGEVAFVDEQLGNLAWSTGHLDAANRNYRAALAAAPQHAPAMFGLARVRAARGDVEEAQRLAAQAIARRPQLEYIAWYGELLDHAGRRDQARNEYALARATIDLQRAQGVDVDLEAALFEADHGDATTALRLARAAYDRRPSVYAADAFAWTLHVAGHDRAALEYAGRALRLGTRNALVSYHKGAIELALGKRTAARADLGRALALNPYFSPIHAGAARTALDSLGGAR
jgi:tetratricopeptide (TPR) repeat protein